MKKKKNTLTITTWADRKVIEVVCSSRISFLAFCSSEEVLSAQVRSLASVGSPRISLSQNSHRTRQTKAGDKGCAEACAERFSALKDQHSRHVVSSLSRGHLRNVFVKSFGFESDFDLLSFYKGLGRKIFTQISLRMVLFSVWWR